MDGLPNVGHCSASLFTISAWRIGSGLNIASLLHLLSAVATCFFDALVPKRRTESRKPSIATASTSDCGTARACIISLIWLELQANPLTSPMHLHRTFWVCRLLQT